MPTIKAPFNFVPLSEKVFFPNWADKISHDIPFEDGVSGEIKLKITAKTPIFVRNGHSKEDADNKNSNYKSFSKTLDDKYFIPSTSIKGAIRNVLEIMSFSKMSNVDNQSFGIRDLSKSADGTFYRNKIQTENIRCGWLVKKNDEYFLDDCGHPWRVSLDDIDNEYQTELADFAYNGDLKDDYNRTSQKKYDLFSGNELHNFFIPDQEKRDKLKVGNRKFVRFDQEGEGGTIVFTGQSSNRKLKRDNKGKVVKNKKGEDVWEGKFFEFIIPDNIEQSDIKVDDFVVKEFISIHQNSPDFKDFRKQQLNAGERIPVFFKYNDDNEIESIGLSYMYKLPAFNSIYNAMPGDNFSDKYDLSECIFGTENQNNAIKGRVQFTNAWAEKDTVEVLKEIPMLLVSPHPSYYPLYLGNGQTWNSDKINIAGRKRYPVRDKKDMLSPTIGTKDMESIITPLNDGAVFTSKVRFFNLKEVELGALLMALTFKNQGDCFHSLGMAKPLGYGKVKIEISLPEELRPKDYISIYSQFMEKNFAADWEKQIEELYFMAKGIPEGRGKDFSYMTMDTKSSQFKDGKDKYAQGEQLGNFSQIISGDVPKCKYLGNVDENAKRINLEKEIAERKKKIEKWNYLFNLALDFLEKENFDECKDTISDIEKINVFNQELNAKLDDLKNDLNSKINSKIEFVKSELELLINSKNFDDALILIETNNSLFDFSIYKQRIKMEQKLEGQSFVDYLNDCSTSVPLKNFPTYLKKWKNFESLNDRDYKDIAEFLKSRYPKETKKISKAINEAFAKVVTKDKLEMLWSLL